MELEINTRRKKRLKLILKVLVTIALLYYLITYVRYDQIKQAVIESNKYYLLIVFLLMFLNVYLQFLKWRVVCNSLLQIYNNGKIWRSLFYGFSAGIVTPIRVGEYLGRKMAFEGVGLLKVTISTIIEKFASLFIVLIVGGIILISFLSKYYEIYYGIPILVFLVIISVLVFLVLNGTDFSSKTFTTLAEKYTLIKNIQLELSYVRKLGIESIQPLLLYSVLFYLVIILQYALLAKAFELDGNIFLFLGAGAIVFFVKSFLSFISFADLGVRESTSVFLMNTMGYTSVVGFNSAIFLFLFNLVLPAVIGLFLFIKKEN